jgi:hypothetical protein
MVDLAREIADVFDELDTPPELAAELAAYDWRVAMAIARAKRNQDEIPGWSAQPGKITRRRVVEILRERRAARQEVPA